MEYLRGILHQAAEEVGPGDVVHGVLFGGDGSRHYLGIHVIWKHLQETDNQK